MDMFYLVTITVLIILGAYAILLFWLIIGLGHVSQINLSNASTKTSFSIIVALRNEAAHLPSLLHSLSNLTYPHHLFEILFVDDASTDSSLLLLREFIEKHPKLSVQILSNERETASPKKDAMRKAIQKSKNEWIVTTDADCTVCENWLVAFNTFISNNKVVFIAGPVLYKKGHSFIHNFQELDWLSLVGTTVGSFAWNKPIMCSGANLAYKKEVFNEVDGFKGNDHIASGDDVFLLHKIHKKYPNQVYFMNDQSALVKTMALNTWKEVYHQRIRWAKKTSNLPSLLAKSIGICVFLMNSLLIILVVLSIVNSLFLWFLLTVFLTKFILDGLLLLLTSKVVHERISLKHCLLSSLLYPLFSTSIVLLSLFKKYKWKGKTFTK